jgi:L-ascorbate metabolism protein UlaG (beta-lactamase superfamily)
MKTLFTVVFMCITLAIQSQDQVETRQGSISIHPVLHGSLILAWEGANIVVDPYGGGALYTDSEVDLVLITDIHGDHYNPKTLNELNLESATIVAPEAVAELLSNSLRQKTIMMSNGQEVEYQGITIRALPMYNLPETDDSRHPKGRGNGYVLEIGEKRIYISGDTEDIPEMRNLKDIDVAFVCMNLPYTMDINQAADAVLEFAPKVVYPYHYRGGGGTYSDVEAFKQLVNDGNKKIDVRIRDWYNN